MAAWSNAVAGANAAFLATWGQPAQFFPQSGGGPIAISGVEDKPALLEDVLPGSATGTSVVRFWVDAASISPQPQKGDQITLSGVNYDVFEVAVDPDGGGALLKLRRH